MPSGSSAEEFTVSPERERAFQELLKSARQLHGWSQQDAERVSKEMGLPIHQTLLSNLERGPYPGMRFWDIYKLCRIYGIQVSQVLDALGWSDAPKESKNERRVALILDSIRDLPDEDVDTLLSVIERFIVGSRHTQE